MKKERIATRLEKTFLDNIDLLRKNSSRSTYLNLVLRICKKCYTLQTITDDSTFLWNSKFCGDITRLDIYIDEDIYEWIEKKREMFSRSMFIRMLIKRSYRDWAYKDVERLREICCNITS